MNKPTDLELMAYADGELDTERLAEVEAYLASDDRGRRKLGGLRTLGAVLRDQAQALAEPTPGEAGPADGIADAVMARIAAGAAMDRGDRAAEANGAVPAKGGDVLSFARRAAGEPPRASSPASRRAAVRESSRSIFALAAVAVAAAAAMMIWGRIDGGLAPQQAPVAAETGRAAEAPQPVAEATAEPPTPDDVEVGVEVAAVDFGSRTGAIFYVPSGGAAPSPTTTVVWVNDLLGEEQ